MMINLFFKWFVLIVWKMWSLCFHILWYVLCSVLRTSLKIGIIPIFSDARKTEPRNIPENVEA